MNSIHMSSQFRFLRSCIGTKLTLKRPQFLMNSLDMFLHHRLAWSSVWALFTFNLLVFCHFETSPCRHLIENVVRNKEVRKYQLSEHNLVAAILNLDMEMPIKNYLIKNLRYSYLPLADLKLRSLKIVDLECYLLPCSFSLPFLPIMCGSGGGDIVSHSERSPIRSPPPPPQTARRTWSSKEEPKKCIGFCRILCHLKTNE